MSTQEQGQTWEIETGVIRCQETPWYPKLGCEIVKVYATSRNATPETFHELAFPIEYLDERLTRMAVQLENLYCVTFNDPISCENFATNRIHIKAMILHILTRVPSLRRVTLSAYILDDDIFRALSFQSYLREVKLLPSTIFKNGKAQINDVLDKGMPQLQKVGYLKIPLEVVRLATVLSCLGRLPRLHSLEITGSPKALYPELFFDSVKSKSLGLQTQGWFENLRLLKFKPADMPKNSTTSPNTYCTRIFRLESSSGHN